EQQRRCGSRKESIGHHLTCRFFYPPAAAKSVRHHAYDGETAKVQRHIIDYGRSVCHKNNIFNYLGYKNGYGEDSGGFFSSPLSRFFVRAAYYRSRGRDRAKPYE